MSYQEYLDKYFNGVAAEMARFWDKDDQAVQRWKHLTFYVIDGDHVKANKNSVRKVIQ